jgi:two-component system chemotaxis response regulator CheB
MTDHGPGRADGLRVVALVCSAGGLDALSRVLSGLPADLPAAVVALQHLSPDRPSELASLLAVRTSLTVRTAHDGDRLTPGRVLVAPSGRHLLLTNDGTVALVRSGALPPARPSADLLLTSLALTAGARAVAVVLTGYGTDGAVGAAAVHRLGGVVVTSDEATSLHFAMPSATITSAAAGGEAVADHIVGLDDVAPLLISLVCEPGGPVTS